MSVGSQRLSTLMSITASTSGAVGPLNQFNAFLNTTFSGIQQSAQAVGVKATIAGASIQAAFRPVQNLFEGVIGAGLKFDEQMARTFGSISDGMKNQAAITQAALDVGIKYALSNVEAASALETLGKAGRDSTQAISELEPVVRFAEANTMDLNDAAKIVAITMTQFADQNLTATDVINALSAAALNTTADVGDFGLAFSHVGAVMDGLGVPFNDAVVDMAALAQGGIESARAATTLRGVMVRMVAPTKEAADQWRQLGIDVYETGQSGDATILPMREVNTQLQQFIAGTSKDEGQQRLAQALTDIGVNAYGASGKLLSAADMVGLLKSRVMEVGTDDAEGIANLDTAFQELGISFVGTTGKLKPMPEIMTELAGKLKGVQDPTEVLRSLFTQTGIEGAQTLLKLNSDDWDKLRGKVVDNGDALNSLLAVVQSTLPYRIKVLQGNFELLQTQIFDQIKPTLLTLVNYLIKLSEAFKNTSPEVKRFVGIALAIGAVIAGVVGPALIIFGLLSLAFASLAVVAAPVGIIIAAIALVFFALKDRLGEVRDAIQPIIDAFGLLKAQFDQGLTGDEMGGLKKLQKFIGDVMIAGIEHLARSFQVLVDIIVTVRQALNGNWHSSEGINPLVNAIGIAVLKFKEFLPFIHKVIDVIGGLIDRFRNSDTAMNILGKALLALMAIGIVEFILGIVGALGGLALALLGIAVAGPVKALKTLVGTFKGLGNAILGTSKKKDDHIKNLAKLQDEQKKTTERTGGLVGAFKTLKKTFADVAKSTKNVFGAVLSQMQTVMSKIADMGKALKDLGGYFVDLGKKAADALKPKQYPAVFSNNAVAKPTISERIEKVTTIMTQKFVTIGTSLLGLINDAKSKTITTTQKFLTVGTNLLDKIKAAVDKTVTITQNFVTVQTTKAVDLGSSLKDAGVKAATGLAGGIGQGLGFALTTALMTPAVLGSVATSVGAFLAAAAALVGGGWILLIIAAAIALLAIAIFKPEWIAQAATAIANFFYNTLPYILGAIAGFAATLALTIVQRLLEALAFVAPYAIEAIALGIGAFFYSAFLAVQIGGAIAVFAVKVMADMVQFFLIQVPFAIAEIFLALATAFVKSFFDLAATLASVAKIAFISIPLAIFHALVDTFQAAFPLIGQILKDIITLHWGRAVQDGFDLLKLFFIKFPQDIAGRIGGDLGKIADKFRELFDKIKLNFGDAFANIGITIGKLADNFKIMIGKISGHFTELKNNIKNILEPAWELLKTSAEKALDAVVAGMEHFAGRFAEGFKDHFNSDAMPKIEKAWDDFKRRSADKIEELKGEAEKKFDKIRDAIVDKIHAIVETAAQRWEDLKTAAREKFEQLRSDVEAKIEDLKSKAATKWEELKTKATEEFEKLKEQVKGKLKELQGDLPGIMAGIIGEIIKAAAHEVVDAPGTAVGQFYRMGKGFLEGLKSIISGGAETISGVMGSIVSAITGFIQDPGHILYSVGKQIGAGLVKGVVDGAGRFAKYLGGIVGDGIDAAKDVGIIQSPSKAMAYVGRMLTEGLFVGLGDGKELYNKMAGHAGLVISGITDPLKISSPSQAMIELAHQIIDGLIVGMDDDQIDLAKKIADLAKTIVDGLTAVLDFSKRLSTEGVFGIDQNKLDQLAQNLTQIMNEISAAVADFSVDALDELNKKLGPAKASIDAFSAVFDLLSKLAEDDGALSVSISAIGKLKLALEKAINELVLMFDVLGEDALNKAGQASANAQQIAEGFSAIVEMMKGIADLGSVGQTSIDKIGNLKLALEKAITELQLMFDYLGQETINKAATAVESAEPIGKGFLAIIDMLKGISTLGDSSADDFDKIGTLKLALERAVTELSLMFNYLGPDVIKNALTAAQAADDIGKGFKAITDFIRLLAKTADVSFDPDDITKLAGAMTIAMQRLSEAFDAVGQPMIDNAGTFAKNGKDVAEALTSTLKLLGNAMKQGAIEVDQRTIDDLVNAMQMLVQTVSAALGELDQGLLDNAKNAASAGGEIADSLLKVFDFLTGVADAKVVVLAPGKIRSLVSTLQEIINQFKTAIGYMDEDTATLLKDAADAANSILEVFKTLTDVFGEGIDKFNTAIANLPPATATQKVADFLGQVVDQLSLIAGDYDKDVLDLTSQFADTSASIVDVFAKIPDALDAISKFKAPSKAAVGRVIAFISQLVTDLEAIAVGFDKDSLDLTTLFATTAGSILDVFSKIVDALEGVSKFRQPSKKAMSNIEAFFQQLVKDFIAISKKFDEGELDAAKLFADNVNAMLDAINGAVDFFESVTTDMIREVKAGAIRSRTVIDLIGEFMTNLRQAGEAAGAGSLNDIFDNLAIDGSGWGTDFVVNFGDGMDAGFNHKVRPFLDKLSQYFSDFFVDNFVNVSRQWGFDMMENFAQGLTDGMPDVVLALQALAASIEGIMGFSLPDTGPLSTSDEWMPDFMTLLANGIRQNSGQVIAAATAVAGQLSGAMTPSLPTGITPGFMGNTMDGTIVGSISLGGITVEGTGNPQADGEVAGTAAMNAILTALRTRKS